METENKVVATFDAGGGIMVDVVDRVPKTTPKIAKKKPVAKKSTSKKVTPASLLKKVKDIKQNKVVRVAKPKSEAVVAKEKESAKACGLGLRCYRILKAVCSVDARISCAEITAKTGIVANHLSGQMWGSKKLTWGAGEESLGTQGLIRRYDDAEGGGYRVGLTAKGAKVLAKATVK